MAEEERNRKLEEPTHTAKRDDDEPMLFCPVCSQRLAQNHCKLVCEKCGYFMSCADYY
jgi:hypothetical protein